MRTHHRGSHPKDSLCFAADQLPKLCSAVAELSWLLERAYSLKAAAKLVGDRHQLTQRQHLAVARVACADTLAAIRQRRCVAPGELRGRNVVIDGFNLVITIETALGGGALFACRDGCYRDLSSVYGSYTLVEESEPAIVRIGTFLSACRPSRVEWLFDRPVSNSGRIAERVRTLSETNGWPFEAKTTDRTDAILAQSSGVVVSCDSAVLDHAGTWCNLARELVTATLPDAWVIDLQSAAAGE